MARFDRRFLSIEEQTVPVRTLDSFEFTPDVVKIDVQGAEHQVVKGAVETFRRADPITIVEAPTKELVDLFASLNMTAYALQGDSLTAKWRASTNVLFLSAKRRRQLKL
jgi:hypothetical protein